VVVVAVLFFFVLLFAVVFPPDPALDHLRPRNRVGAGVLKLVDRFHARAQGSSDRMAGIFLRFLNRLSPITRNALGAGALVLGVVGTYAIGPAGLAAQHGRADSASVWPGVLLAGAGLWVLLLPPTHGGHANRVSWPWRVSFRAILMVACAWALGEALWLLPFFTDGAIDTGPYCLWGVGFLIFLSAVGGRIVDAADIRSPLPLKVMAASVLVIFFGITGNDSLGSAGGGVAAEADQGVGDRWYDAMLQRIEAMPGKGPVVLVAASGGGSRAALFAALAYEAMEALPLDPNDPQSPTVGSHIVAISSVSGGSLASAWYQHARKDGEPLPRLHTRGLGRWPVLTATMQEEATRLAVKAEQRFGKSPASALFATVNTHVSQLPGTPLPDAPWLESSQFVSDMGENFMAAVLRAVVEPGMSRGESITRLWTSDFGLGELNNAPGTVPGMGPAVLFNATEVESGRRFVIGFPRLPPELLGNAMGSMDDAAGSLWVNGAQAARLSANFPWASTWSACRA